MSRLTAIFAGAAIAATPVGAQVESYGKYQMPSYTVANTLGEVEIRDYGAHILAEVAVKGDRRGALNRGFRTLAGFIFGGNQAQTSVAMTAPVAQSQKIDMTVPVAQTQTDGVWTVTFMMPREWTLDTLPKPDSDAIRFREVAPARAAVVQFSGRATDDALARAEARLRTTLSEAGIDPTGPTVYQFYDDPMTLPWNRRNEVSVPIAAANR